MTTDRKEHWEEYWKRFSVDSSTRVTYLLTAKIVGEFLRNAFVKSELCILDLGCGRGDIAGILRSFLSENGYIVRIFGLDISVEALNVLKEINTEGIYGISGNAMKLPFCDETFDAVISFGYASVASYNIPEIQKEIYRVLKSEGILISDFRNVLSLYFFLLKPHWIFKSFKRFLGFEKPAYHFGTFGVRRYFAQFGLNLQKIVFTNSFPPLSMNFLEKTLMVFEQLIYRIRLGRLFGRIFIAVFNKVDWHKSL